MSAAGVQRMRGAMHSTCKHSILVRAAASAPPRPHLHRRAKGGQDDHVALADAAKVLVPLLISVNELHIHLLEPLVHA